MDSIENNMFQVDLRLSTVKSLIHDQLNSAAGPDRIPTAIYKRLMSNLAPSLLFIFQQLIKKECARACPYPEKLPR